MFRETEKLFALLALSVSMVLAPTANAAPSSMIEQCMRAVNDYAWYLDHPNPDPKQTARKFARLFTQDARLTLLDDDLAEQTHVGHEAITKYYLDNRTHTRFLHVVSNIRVTATSDKTATGTSYVSFYFHAMGGSMKDEGAITGIAEFRDEYRITRKGCKFSRRKSISRLLSLDGRIEAPLAD